MTLTLLNISNISNISKVSKIRLYLLLALVTIVCICSVLLWSRKGRRVNAVNAVNAVNERFNNTGKFLMFRISDSLDYSATSSIPVLQPFSELADSYPNWLGIADSYNDANFITFETLSKIDLLMQQIAFPNETKYIFGLRASDMIASKSLLALTLKGANLLHLMPRTYVTEGGTDRNAFLSEYDDRKIYILKKNVQRQEGFVITSDKTVLLDAFEKQMHSGHTFDYVVCQELLQDPLVIRGRDLVSRKINLRVYLLVVVSSSGTSIFMYDDGFVYYTADAWTPQSLLAGPNITTGYVDRQVYADNPLTTQDLYSFLDLEKALALRANMIATLTALASTYKPIFQNNNNTYPGTKFMIYGCDIAPAVDLTVKIMEVNKGPDLGYKDVRDKALKLGMVRDALQIVGILPLPVSAANAANAANAGNKFVKLV